MLDPLPEVPVGREQVDGHLAAACPGVPELVGIEAAGARRGDVVEPDAEMAIDLFDPKWTVWDWVERDLEDLRREWNVTPAGPTR